MNRVLHFGRYFSIELGGIPRHVGSLLPGLSNQFAVDNLVASTGRHSEHFQVAGYSIYQAGVLGTLASTAISPAMARLARQLDARHRYDIIHLHFPDPMSHLAAMAMPLGKRKLVISWHSDILRQKLPLVFYRPLQQRILERADAIIIPTPKHSTSSTQLTGVPANKLHVIPYGLDYAPYLDPAAAAGAALRAKYGQRPLIFSVGRHVYYKGFDTLVRAMVHVRPDALLLLGGTGPLSGKLRQQAEAARLGERIVFTGYIPESRLPAYYHAADVFCMPSVQQTEAFGLVQLEAMACGKPVVCGELDNGVTWVNRAGETGLVVPPGDPIALAAALDQLLDDAELRGRLGHAARQRALEEFSLEHMINGTTALYRGLLGA